MSFWVDKGELVAERDGAQRQPGAIPAPAPLLVDVPYESGVVETMARIDALLDRINEVAAIAASTRIPAA